MRGEASKNREMDVEMFPKWAPQTFVSEGVSTGDTILDVTLLKPLRHR
jgi:hypothetical protein